MSLPIHKTKRYRSVITAASFQARIAHYRKLTAEITRARDQDEEDAEIVAAVECAALLWRVMRRVV